MSELYKTHLLPGEQHTKILAEALAKSAKKGDVYFLRGDLGAGKTTFARHFIRFFLGANEPVPSPTFTLIQSYDTDNFPIWHIDLYRLTSSEEVLELGLEEIFKDGVSLIEWPERLGSYGPDHWIEVNIKEDSAGRTATIKKLKEHETDQHAKI